MLPTNAPFDSVGYLPRLAREFYRGLAHVFWTHTIEDRGKGWLTRSFHQAFREIMVHACVREQLVCPVYSLIPDHFHIMWLGTGAPSDQLRASPFLRVHLQPLLAPFSLQHQAYDHVLTEAERERGAFMDTVAYIATIR
ncbi:MAG: hypothetical protein JWM88_2334 [Verrucomicrobia bacterium]|nr:hypothetical protein [Verrucomicrobiota bacterium]